MRHESTAPWCHALPCARGGVALATLAALVSAASAADVVVRVENVVPSTASVFVSLCVGGLEPNQCGLAQSVAARAPVVAARFAGVAPGVYAAAAFQDSNGNGTLDRSPRGLPREPYGFSREAGRSAAPRFDRAAFAVEGDAVVTVRLGPPGRP